LKIAAEKRLPMSTPFDRGNFEIGTLPPWF
jgi:hypothetical protein